ncbi:dienelactone hydrolase [Amanita rubescens]|nr:dienelactone hydrolase [Amanita rubescens]
MSSTVHNPNTACCSIPPVHSSYSPKGTFQSIGNFHRVYVTGPDVSENAIICVYDIFGYFRQTQQGADLIASALKTTVYMPDFFEPHSPFPAEKFPPENPAELEAFFDGTANLTASLNKLVAFGHNLKADGKKKVGVYGFCWGGKVTILAGNEDTPFASLAIIHPAMLSAKDADKLTIPLAIYISKNEPVYQYNNILQTLSNKPFAVRNDHKHYTNMFHGWAAARANLENAENKKEYEDVYTRLAAFFHKTLF